MKVLVCLESSRPSRASRFALHLACTVGEGAHIMALSVGGSAESESLDLARRCTGIERVVHLDDPTLEQADFFTLGMVLAESARHLGADLVVTGERSDEEGQGLVPAAVAHYLRAPLLSHVQAIAPSSTGPRVALVTLRAGGRLCSLLCPLPLVASAPPLWTTTQSVTERSPCPLESLTLEQLGIDPSRLVFRPDLLGTLVPGRGATERRKTFDEAAEILLRRDH